MKKGLESVERLGWIARFDLLPGGKQLSTLSLRFLGVSVKMQV